MIKKQLGVTLIELMVSMMLGLALVSGISQLFIQSQKSFTLQRNISDMMDDGVFVLEDLAKGLLLAGFYPSATSIPVGYVVPGYIGTNSTDNELYYSFILGDLSQLNNSICLSGASNCISTSTNCDPITVHVSYDTTSGDLSCISGSASQPLIQNVKQLTFKYGIRNGTSPNYTFYYTDAATVTANNQWTNVIAIKVFLVLRSTDDNLNRIKGYYYDIDGNKVTMTDNRLYKTFSKTIFLRANDH